MVQVLNAAVSESAFHCKDLNISLFSPTLLIFAVHAVESKCCCILFFFNTVYCSTNLISIICCAHKSPLGGAVDLGWDLRRFPES